LHETTENPFIASKAKLYTTYQDKTKAIYLAFLYA